MKQNENIRTFSKDDLVILRKKRLDILHKVIIYGFSSFAILSLLLIVLFVIGESLHFFNTYNFWKFLFSKNWNPDSDGSLDAAYGILTTTISTIAILIMSLLFSVPLAIFSSIFICEHTNNSTKKLLINFIRLLAGVPSVIFGLFALTQIGIILEKFGASTNQNFLVASIVLAFMALPIMISLCVNAIEDVPKSYRYASLALGLTKSHTSFKIVLSNAKSGIISAVIMGIARIIGETMAVIMIAGNATTGLQTHNGLAAFLFSSVRTLSGTIGLEMLENHGATHQSALYAIGVALFAIIVTINIIVLWVQTSSNRRISLTGSGVVHKKINDRKFHKINNNISDLTHKEIRNKIWSNTSKKYNYNRILDYIRYGFMISSIVITLSFTLWIILAVLIKSFIAFITVSSADKAAVGINGLTLFGLFLTTIILVITTMAFAIPLSLLVAVFLSEYSNSKNIFAKILNFSINVMASIPSILFGMFGLSIFIGFMHMPLSILTAALTLTFLVIPIMIRSIESSLRNVDKKQKMASLALGASKTETIWKIVIPTAAKGIITAVILSMARIVGESAPVYLTLGTVARMPVAGFLSPGTSLSVKIFMIFKEGSTTAQLNVAYELALIVMSTILLLNLSADGLAKFFTFSNYKDKNRLNKNKIKNLFTFNKKKSNVDDIKSNIKNQLEVQ